MAFFFCHFRSTESVKFHFEECGSDVDEREWMFCHVPGCSFWTSKSWRMERHKLCHSFETSPLESSGSNKRCYKCPDCHLKFFSLAKLLKHDRKKHTGVKDYECRICGAEVTDIQTHMRVIILYWASFFRGAFSGNYIWDWLSATTSILWIHQRRPTTVYYSMIDYRFTAMKRTTSANIVPWVFATRVHWCATCSCTPGSGLTAVKVANLPSRLGIDSRDTFSNTTRIIQPPKKLNKAKTRATLPSWVVQSVL